MVWRRKQSLATWLFIVNRYLLFGVAIWTGAPSTASVRLSQFPLMNLLLTLLTEVNNKLHCRLFTKSLPHPGIVHSCDSGNIFGIVLLMLQDAVLAGIYQVLTVTMLVNDDYSIFCAPCIRHTGSQHFHGASRPGIEFGSYSNKYSKDSLSVFCHSLLRPGSLHSVSKPPFLFRMQYSARTAVA